MRSTFCSDSWVDSWKIQFSACSVINTCFNTVSTAVVQDLYLSATHTYIFTASIVFPPRMSSSAAIWAHISTLFWWILYFVEIPKLPRMHFIPCKIPRHIWVTACDSFHQLMGYNDALNLWALKPRFSHSIQMIEEGSLLQPLLSKSWGPGTLVPRPALRLGIYNPRRLLMFLLHLITSRDFWSLLGFVFVA